MSKTESTRWRAGVVPRLQSLLPNLHGALGEVGRFIAEHPQRVVTLSTAELAQMTGTSEAAVVRLSKRLGYRGYRDLQINLAYDLGDEQPAQVEEIEVGDDLGSITSKVVAANVQALMDSQRILDLRMLESTTQAIVRARRVAVLGQGANYATAADLHYNLTKLGVTSLKLADPYMQAATASILDSNDVLIAITHTGANRDLIEAMTIAKQHGATTVCLTTHMGSPATRLADFSLCTAPKEIVFAGEPFSSRLSLMFLVDVLFIGVALRLEGSRAMLRRVQDALQAKRSPHNLRPEPSDAEEGF